MRVDDERVGGRDHALHQHGHAQVAEVEAYLAHAQQRALVVLARPHTLPRTTDVSSSAMSFIVFYLPQAS